MGVLVGERVPQWVFQWVLLLVFQSDFRWVPPSAFEWVLRLVHRWALEWVSALGP